MAPHLQLVQDDGPLGGRLHGEGVLRPPAARPGDRTEAVTLTRSAQIDELAAASAAAGLGFDLAVALLAQRQLVCDDLSGLVPHFDEILDTAATAQSIDGVLSGAPAAYLRDLQRRVPLQPERISVEASVSVPVRFIDRFLGGDRSRGLSHRFLEQARTWEIASVATGRTMSEWSALTIATELAERAKR